MPQRFLNALKSGKVLLMDGAMGTELQRAGLAADACNELWNVTNPAAVRQVHRAYVEAGADVLLTNTFQANPARLAGAKASVESVISEGLHLAYCACTPLQFTLVSVGPFCPPQQPPDRPAEEMFPALNLAAHCADGVLFETWSDLYCVELAGQMRLLDPALANMPVLLSVTFRREGNEYRSLAAGEAPEWYAGQAQKKGFAALGVNCGLDITVADCAEVIRRYRRETELPLFARPNAGSPAPSGDERRQLRTPTEMAEELAKLLAAGVIMVGGCCGTTPEHTRAFRAVIDQWNARGANA